MNRPDRTKQSILLAALLFTLIAFAPAARAQTKPRPDADAQGREVTAAETLLFGSGKELYTTGRYAAAAETFKLFQKIHRRSEIADLVVLWLGRSSLICGDKEDAKRQAGRLRLMKSAEYAALLEGEIAKAATGPKPKGCSLEDETRKPTPDPKTEKPKPRTQLEGIALALTPSRHNAIPLTRPPAR